MPTPLIPDGRPLSGRWLRLALLGEDDLAELYPVLADPAVYQQGYVMHHRPDSVEDARELGCRVFLGSVLLRLTQHLETTCTTLRRRISACLV